MLLPKRLIVSMHVLKIKWKILEAKKKKKKMNRVWIFRNTNHLEKHENVLMHSL